MTAMTKRPAKLDPIPAIDRVRALQRRRSQLEQRSERCRRAVQGMKLNPSAGRELDDARATLAAVLSELERIAHADAGARADVSVRR
jgi:hypothetical protein